MTTRLVRAYRICAALLALATQTEQRFLHGGHVVRLSSYVIAGQCKAQGQGANFLVGGIVYWSPNRTTPPWNGPARVMQCPRNRREKCDPFAGGLLPGRQLPPSLSFSTASLARPLTAAKKEEGAARRSLLRRLRQTDRRSRPSLAFPGSRPFPRLQAFIWHFLCQRNRFLSPLV